VAAEPVTGNAPADEDPVPHLTVGERPAGGVAELRAAEEAVRAQLPIRAQVGRVWLMTRRSSPGGWRTVAEFPLADPPLADPPLGTG
jgi:hypothetical protein